MPGPDPRHEYEQRLADRRASARAHAARELTISNARLVVAIIAALAGWLAWGPDLIPGWWLLAPAAGFLGLVVAHERIIQARRRCERAAAHYEDCLARLDHRWIGRGVSGERFADPDHPYAADLDLFGRGSLFERICTARTRAGEDALASWLTRPAAADVVRARQEAVAELRDRIDLREDLALLGADVRSGVHPDELSAWAAQPPAFASQAPRRIAPALALAAVAALAAWAAGLTGPAPFAAAVALEALFAFPLRPRVRHVVGAVETAGRDLALLSQVLGRIERESFRAPLLEQLRADLDTGGVAPSEEIHRLHRLIGMLDARRNQIFAPVAYLLLWATQIAHAIEAWRAECGGSVGRWLAAVGEIEALVALAGYAHDNPDDPFAEIAEPGDGAVYDGHQLGHPLIPAGQCVRNDLSLGEGPRVLIVSGSNMSGKSTLLRTVGTNAVLALAGAPVRARRLRLSPLSLGASIRVQDSLQAGTSRFYAEITRLRQIVDLTAGPGPVLFLIDEMLHGTNSHDRRIGAEAVVTSLVRRDAIGLVTTHDLALSQITGPLGERAHNVHFEDHLEDGRMTFDYVMRPGVVEKSNALELMRAVGLEI